MVCYSTLFLYANQNLKTVGANVRASAEQYRAWRCGERGVHGAKP